MEIFTHGGIGSTIRRMPHVVADRNYCDEPGRSVVQWSTENMPLVTAQAAVALFAGQPAKAEHTKVPRRGWPRRGAPLTSTVQLVSGWGPEGPFQSRHRSPCHLQAGCRTLAVPKLSLPRDEVLYVPIP